MAGLAQIFWLHFLAASVSCKMPGFCSVWGR